MKGTALLIGGVLLDDDDLFNQDNASWTSPTLDIDFTSVNGLPFEPQYTRKSFGCYRMNADGNLVLVAVDEPVIEKDRDE